MASQNTPPRNINNKIHIYLERDVPSITFSEQKTSTGLKKVILIDKKRRHRSFAYVSKNGNVIATKNELSIDYLSKYCLDLDLRKVARAPSKINTD